MPNLNIQTPNWLQQTEAILEELNEGVVIADNELRVVFANEALLRLGQYQRSEIQGHTPDTIFPPKDIPYINQQHESGHRARQTRHEFYLPGKDGQKIPAISVVGRLRGLTGRNTLFSS